MPLKRATVGLGAVWGLWLLLPVVSAVAQQVADPDFDTSVARPAYPPGGPVVVLDEAHANFHTADGRYKPFADSAAQ